LRVLRRRSAPAHPLAAGSEKPDGQRRIRLVMHFRFEPEARKPGGIRSRPDCDALPWWVGLRRGWHGWLRMQASKVAPSRDKFGRGLTADLEPMHADAEPLFQVQPTGRLERSPRLPVASRQIPRIPELRSRKTRSLFPAFTTP
jgi:hypothetical protein